MRWRSKKDLQDDYSISRNTVDRILEMMRENIGIRYDEEDFLYIGGRLRVNEKAFYDAVRHRELIKRDL